MNVILNVLVLHSYTEYTTDHQTRPCTIGQPKSWWNERLINLPQNCVFFSSLPIRNLILYCDLHITEGSSITWLLSKPQDWQVFEKAWWSQLRLCWQQGPQLLLLGFMGSDSHLVSTIKCLICKNPKNKWLRILLHNVRVPVSLFVNWGNTGITGLLNDDVKYFEVSGTWQTQC